MDLKEFVSETISSIIAGVVEAQHAAFTNDAYVNPTNLTRNITNVSQNATWDNSNNNYAQIVSFDVAVTAEDSATAGAKVKVIAGLFGAGANAESGNRNSLASRVQFTVPILFPPNDVGNEGSRAESVGVVRRTKP